MYRYVVMDVKMNIQKKGCWSIISKIFVIDSIDNLWDFDSYHGRVPSTTIYKYPRRL